MCNLDKFLYILKGLDKTESIDKWDYKDGQFLISFNSGKTFNYNKDNVAIYELITELNPHDYHIIANGQVLYNIVRIQEFTQHIRVFYQNGSHEIFFHNSVIVMRSALVDTPINNLLDYFKRLADEDVIKNTTDKKIKNDDDNDLHILKKHFDKIDFVREDSVLADYLKGKINSNHCNDSRTLCYPFGFNISQKQAADNAMNYRFSIIEGPPGTGKTQTILNIIANAVMSGKSVAVVSSNNSATENVEEKLKKYGVDFIAAFLGSSKNKEAFILDQKEIPNLDSWELRDDECNVIKTMLENLNETLYVMLEKKNKLSELRLKLDAIQVEQQHFLSYSSGINTTVVSIRSYKTLNATDYLRLMAQAEIYKQQNKPFTFIKKIINLFRYGIINFSFYKNPIDTIITFYQINYYKAEILDLKQQIDELENALESYNFDQQMKKYSDLSMRLFKNKLAEKYKKHSRTTYTEEDLWKNSEQFISDYPVILSTTYSLRSSLNSSFVYDYVIIDEASQVSITTGALAFLCAKRAVVVGDLKQLPNVVDKNLRTVMDSIWKQTNYPEPYRYSNHSLLRSVSELFTDVPRTMLREHYRCNPKIINFCNQKFYNNQLIVLTEENEDREPLIVYKTIKGNHARDHVNQRQIDVIKNEIIPQQKIDVLNTSVGIVTPYRNQANVLQKEFNGTEVEADTVDKFQGHERDIIIISTVDNNISDFADDDNRLNVAISRAISQLILVITGNEPTRQTTIGDLVNYILYNNMQVINSEIYSVFDLLYKQYANIRREEMRKLKKISQYDSENIMYDLITKTLNKSCFSDYDVLFEVPLKMIIRDLSKLESERELEFVSDENTHIDFVVFNTFSHLPVLLIEVDGVSFHKSGSEQEERDKLKNSIVSKYNLPLERFRTDGSNEEERLKTVLEKLKTF